MTTDFIRNTVRSIALLFALLALDRLPALTKSMPLFARLNPIIHEMHNGGLSADDFHALVGSYYEGIEKVDRISDNNVQNRDFRLRDDFLRFEFEPRLRRQGATGLRVTNSFGMTSPEYGHEKPPNTRRIAWLGDSVSSGPWGHSFERLLEERLNRDDRSAEVKQFQLLNFSVPGYVLLQEMFVALEKAPKFHPDVYIVQLDNQEIVGSRKHLARQVVNGWDLRYDFLRRLVPQAGIKSTDDIGTAIVKLKPLFVPLTRSALEVIRDHTRAEGAQMIIVLIPIPVDPDIVAQDFDALHQATDGLGVPVIDVRETFRNANLRSLQAVPDVDIHPNVKGHEMIYEDLYGKLRANHDAWTALTGAAAESTGR
jgi:hypothetical protein